MRKTVRMIGITALCFALLLPLVCFGADAKADESSSDSSAAAATADQGDTSAAAATADQGDTSAAAAATADQDDTGEGSKSGKRVYFAAPLFSQGERDYNLKLAKVLEDHGYEVFLPQRDGFLASELEGKTEEEIIDQIFEKDTSEILKSDILFMLLDGRVPDEGACVELGIGYANNKRCYGFKTDARSMEINMDLNPMIAGCFKKIFRNNNGDALIEELEQYLSENEL